MQQPPWCSLANRPEEVSWEGEVRQEEVDKTLRREMKSLNQEGSHEERKQGGMRLLSVQGRVRRFCCGGPQQETPASRRGSISEGSVSDALKGSR